MAIWKKKAERLISPVQRQAYPEAAKYLQKAAELSRQQQTQAEWQQYLRGLRKTHARKRRRLEILDRLEGKPGRGKSH